MKPTCREIRKTLVASGPAALRGDEAAQEHLVDCGDCFAFIEALAELERAFEAMPAHDAPDDLVEQLLASPELAVPGPVPQPPPLPRQRPRWVEAVQATAGWVAARRRRWVLVAAPVAAVLAIGMLAVMTMDRAGLAPTMAMAPTMEHVIGDEALVETEPSSSLDAGKVGQLSDVERQIEGTEQEVAGEQLLALGEDTGGGGGRSDPAEVERLERKAGELRKEKTRILSKAEARREREEEGGRPMRQVPADDMPRPSSPAPSAAAGLVVPDTTEPGNKRQPEPAPTPAPAAKAWHKADGNVNQLGDRALGMDKETFESPAEASHRGEAELRASVVGGLSSKTERAKANREVDVISAAPVVDTSALLDQKRLPEPSDSRLARVAGKDQAEVDEDGELVFGHAVVPAKQGAGRGRKVRDNMVQPTRIGGLDPVYPQGARSAGVQGVVVLRCTIGPQGTVMAIRVLHGLPLGLTEAAVDAVKTWTFEPATIDGRPVEVEQVIPVRFSLVADPRPTDGSLARQFLAERASVDGLELKEARGYWANTYVPGDWELRRLQTLLAGRDRAGLQAFGQAPLRLHDASRQAAQPFDPSDDAALAVYLHADRRGLAARQRLLLEVGVRGTPRHSGRRGAMNLAVVLDLRGEVPVETATAMRALLDAFVSARDIGDRFSVVVAGRPGAVAVPASDFRHGPVTVAMSRLLGDEGLEGPTLSLGQAADRAIDLVGAADDPTTPLGSSAVVLVTGQALGDAVGSLAARAHASAVEGVPVSAVGVGGAVRLDELDRLVLAGQGNRRLLQAPAEAEALVDRELSAVGRVIARAVRLRIRLAPGVQLVDVLGSERLDEARAQQVRDAEVSIDQRLSRNLGIQADRGADEDGIQIVIPTFYANDCHVILLDLVAPGPGPVADVTVRYKDLVWMGNGVARAHLSLGRSEAPAGPLELNVLKNLLARRLGETLERAGDALASGDSAGAQGMLRYFRTLLAELPAEVPGLVNDPDLTTDITMLDEYLALIDAGADQDAGHREHLADSLRYAGRLKVLPPPVMEQGA